MECLRPRTIKTRPRRTWNVYLDQPVLPRILEVPCGQCAFCMVNRRQSWVFRLSQEMRNQELPSYFLTFTYDERHVPRRNDKLSLRFKDIQLYLKRLRKEGYRAKYVCVGEYGSETERPHYHLILWTDAPVNYIQSNWRASHGDKMPFGHVHFGDVNSASVMYCMKYLINPRRHYVGVERPRAQFSKGLGLSFLTTKMYEYLTQEYGNPVLTVIYDEQTFALPKYYKDKIFTKWELRQVGYELQQERIKERNKQISDLKTRGVKDPEAYLYRLRIDQAKAIYKTQKEKVELL